MEQKKGKRIEWLRRRIQRWIDSGQKQTAIDVLAAANAPITQDMMDVAKAIEERSPTVEQCEHAARASRASFKNCSTAEEVVGSMREGMFLKAKPPTATEITDALSVIHEDGRKCPIETHTAGCQCLDCKPTEEMIRKAVSRISGLGNPGCDLPSELQRELNRAAARVREGIMTQKEAIDALPLIVNAKTIQDKAIAFHTYLRLVMENLKGANERNTELFQKVALLKKDSKTWQVIAEGNADAATRMRTEIDGIEVKKLRVSQELITTQNTLDSVVESRDKIEEELATAMECLKVAQRTISEQREALDGVGYVHAKAGRRMNIVEWMNLEYVQAKYPNQVVLFKEMESAREEAEKLRQQVEELGSVISTSSREFQELSVRHKEALSAKDALTLALAESRNLWDAYGAKLDAAEQGDTK